MTGSASALSSSTVTSNSYQNTQSSTESGRCAVCQKETTKKCGRCGAEFFCGKEHQLEYLHLHQPVCDALYNKASVNKKEKVVKKKSEKKVNTVELVFNAQNEISKSLLDGEISKYEANKLRWVLRREGVAKIIITDE